MRLTSFACAIAMVAAVQVSHDKYFATNEYDTDFAVEKTKGGYDVSSVDNYSSKEDAALRTPIDGEALVKEIDAINFNRELNGPDGAGIKDAADLRDLLSSIKGADVFIGRTPKSQIRFWTDKEDIFW